MRKPDNALRSVPTGFDGLRKRPDIRQLTANVRYRIGYDALKAVYGQQDKDNLLSLIVEVLTSRREYFFLRHGKADDRSNFSISFSKYY